MLLSSSPLVEVEVAVVFGGFESHSAHEARARRKDRNVGSENGVYLPQKNTY
jgi:hypothetical protein